MNGPKKLECFIAACWKLSPGTNNLSCWAHPWLQKETNSFEYGWRSIRGSTPLHFAAQEVRNECVRALLEGGADVNVRDHADVTPLHIAGFKSTVTKEEKIRCFEMLLRARADPFALVSMLYIFFLICWCCKDSVLYRLWVKWVIKPWPWSCLSP